MLETKLPLPPQVTPANPYLPPFMFNVLGTHQGQFETSIGMTRGCDTKCPSSQFVTPLLHMTTSWTSHNGILYHDTNVPEACRSSAQSMNVEDSKMQYWLVQSRAWNFLCERIPMHVPWNEDIPFITDIAHKNSPYFHQNCRFCCDKCTPFILLQGVDFW